jgi:hypothetical protein
MNLLAERPTYKNIFLYVTSMPLSLKEANYKDDYDIFLQREKISNIFIKKSVFFVFYNINL